MLVSAGCPVLRVEYVSPAERAEDATELIVTVCPVVGAFGDAETVNDGVAAGCGAGVRSVRQPE